MPPRPQKGPGLCFKTSSTKQRQLPFSKLGPAPTRVEQVWSQGLDTRIAQGRPGLGFRVLRVQGLKGSGSRFYWASDLELLGFRARVLKAAWERGICTSSWHCCSQRASPSHQVIPVSISDAPFLHFLNPSTVRFLL